MTELRTSARHSAMLDALREGGDGFRAHWAAALGGLVIRDWRWGRIEADWAVNTEFDIGDGTIFGGLTAAMADSFLGLTAMTVCAEEDDRFRTSHLRTDFFKPIVGPTVRLDGRVVNKSRQLIHVEADFLINGRCAVRAAATQVRRKAQAQAQEAGAVA
ncbi:MAG: hypothetical protein Tsb0010_06820 [Parvularculaceae bacterium]